jgi:O-antigen/teichoic acid export membrane protein
MNSYLKEAALFISEFRSRQGGYVFFAKILVKFNALILSILIVRIVPMDEYGYLSYALSIIFLLTAFMGFGANHALLRYGAIQKTYLSKWNVFKYAQRNGFYNSLVLVALVIGFSSLLTNNLPGAQLYLCILSLQLLFSHWNQTQKSLFRVLRLNKLYGYSGILQSTILLVLSITLALLYGVTGYAIAMVLAPLFTFLVYLRLFNKAPKASIKISSLIDKKSFWKYGLFVGVGAVGSQMLFGVGVIVLGNIIPDPEQVAIYKIASLISFNLLFIPQSFLKTDYVYLAESSESRSVLKSYIKKYWSTMALVSLVIFVVFFIFSEPVTMMLFGQRYIESHIILRVLVVGVIGAIMFRSLFGGILMAVGKANWNIGNAFVVLGINVMLCFVLIDRFGVIGAAYALTLSIWIGSIFSGIMILMYLKKYTK